VVAPTMSAGGAAARRDRHRGGRYPGIPGWTVNQIPSTLDGLGAVGSDICGYDLRRRVGWEARILGPFFSSSSRARPRPRLDRSPANPSATLVIQVAISRARMSSMVVVGWFPCRIIFVGQMIVGNWHVAGVELFRALTSSSSLVCSSVNLVQIKARGKCCGICFYSFHDHGQM